MIKERPIIFSAPMVRALLEGRKTQTRRIVKPQPTDSDWEFARKALGGDTSSAYPSVSDRGGIGLKVDRTDDSFVCEATGFFEKNIKCPYGKPGDRLWVRETTCMRYLENFLTGNPTTAECGEYQADSEPILNPAGFDYAWWYSKDTCPAIFMPRFASRILLEITAIRVERLQEITPTDAIAEGVEGKGKNKDVVPDDGWRMSYRNVWESINGPDSWDSNPFVWVVNLQKI